MKPQLHSIDFLPGRWTWHGVPEPVIRFLENPANMSQMRCVKSTQKRIVCRMGSYFLKIDFNHRLKDLFFPAAKNECRAAEKLEKAKIDAVKHLGWGRSGLNTVLVTEAWHSDAEDVAHYWCRNFVYADNNPEEFLETLAAWMRDLLAKPLKHGDFHFGNVLYSPEKNDFTLVDLHNVSVVEGGSKETRRDILHALLELRIALRPSRMLELFWKVANMEQDQAAKEMHRMLLDDLALMTHQWERRVGQFLNGYPKFSEIITWRNQKMLVQRNLLRENFFDSEVAEKGGYRTLRLNFPDALELMLFSFWLSLLLVPHTPIAALAADGTLYIRRIDEAKTEEPSIEAINEFNEYLLCFNLNQEDFRAWRNCGNGRLILTSCTGMLMTSRDRSRFQIAKDWHLQ